MLSYCYATFKAGFDEYLDKYNMLFGKCEETAFQRHFGGSLTIGQSQRNWTDYCENCMERRSFDEQLCDFSDLKGATWSCRRNYKDHAYTVTYEVGLLRATASGSDELDCINRCWTEILCKLKVLRMNGEDGSTPPLSTFAHTLLTSAFPAERSVDDKSREAKRDEINNRLAQLLAYCDGFENARNPARTDDTSPKTDDLPVNGEHQETKPVENDGWNCKTEQSQQSSDHEGENNLTEKIVETEPIEQASNVSEKTETGEFSEQNCEQLIPNDDAAAPKLDSSDGMVEENFANDEIICEINTGGCHDESFADKSESVMEVTENHAVPVLSFSLREEVDGPTTEEVDEPTTEEVDGPTTEEVDGPTTEETEDAVASTSPPLQQDDDKNRTENAQVDLPETEEVDEGNDENNDVVRESVVGDPARKCETDTDNGGTRNDDNDASPKDAQDPTDQAAAGLATEMSGSRHPTTVELFKKFIDDLSTLFNNLTVENTSKTADSLLAILVAADDTDKSYIKLIVDFIMNMVVDDVPGNCALCASLCSKINIGACNNERSWVRNAVSAAFRNHLVNTCVSILWGAEHDEPADDNRSKSPEPFAARRVEFDLESRMRSLAASRFLGQLFLRDDLKIYFQVSRTIQNLIQSCDDHCLECLCVLLTIIGPKLKEIVKFKKTHHTMEEIYDKLKRCAALGRSGESLSKRTVFMLDDLLRLKKNNWIHKGRK